MIKLARINLINWYTFQRLSIDLRDSTALIGPNGAGKSSILDAIQIVLTGNNRNYFQLNASANVTAGQTRRTGEQRSVFDYCLGKVAGETLRERCISYLSLVFEREHDGRCWTIGLGLSAVDGEQDEEVLGAFIAPDQSLTDADFLEDDGADARILPYDQLVTRLKRTAGFENLGHRPTHFTRRVLTALGGKGHHADADKFLKTLRNGLRIREMKSATEFVREFMLDPAGLNVEALRKSVATWRGLLETIENLEVQKKQVGEAIAAYRELLDRIEDEGRFRWVESKAERDRLEAHLTHVTAQHRESIEAQDAADRALALTRDAIERIGGEMREITRALDNDTKEQAIREFRKIDLPIAERDHQAAEARYQGFLAAIVGAVGLVDRIVPVGGGEEARQVAEALAALRSRVGDGTPMSARDVDRIVAQAVAPLELYVGRAQQQRDTHLARIAALKASIGERREQLRTMRGGGVMLANGTTRLIQHLAAHGIAAKSVAELVEVIEPVWADAAETLLGAAREALIVAPEHAETAIGLLRRQRRDFIGTQIVNTTRSRDVGQVPAVGSLADVIATDDPHARAFINRRLNGVRRVQTEKELLSHDRAVTPDCLSASGGSIENRRAATTRLLGKDAAARNIPLVEEAIAGDERALVNHEQGANALALLIADMARFAQAAGGAKLAELERERQSAAEAVAQVQDNIRTLEGERPVAIRERLADLGRDLEGHKDDLKDDEAAQRVAAHKVGSAEQTMRAAAEEFSRADAGFAELGEVEGAGALFTALLEEQGGILPAVRNAARERAAGARGRVTQLLGQAPQKAHAFAYEARILDQFDRDAGPAAQLAWLERQQDAIVTNTLTDYRAQAEEARAAIETALKTDMLVKLHDRLEGAKRQIASLNKSLSVRPFHGELYRFEVKPDPFYAEIVEIARRVQMDSIDVTTLFDGDGEGIEPSLMKGVERLKRMIDEGENVEQISDYRNYLHFELQTTTLDGGRVTSDYAKRQGSGSGGEKQVPFYIAMACAMNNVCHSGEDDRERLGLGIILFDEAFNALDGGNVNSCLSLLRQFNLQVIACAPVDKLGVFMEQMDTVLSIRRIGTQTMLYADYPKEEGRRMFREANPANEPFDLFRERFAAEDAQAAE
ncbi:energy-coupling factor transporter ATP-binding protein EcfA2 [Sphingomonas zeicaulis]|uniref:SbcC/MukB-like Walker B domain-containing protein n=1 Tax=Sphingomonas zeicaulis TaxID=1632740 RepID=UPI003D1E8187